MRIDGKLAVVTGAAVGTGRAIARRLAAEGATVVLADVVLADVDEEGGEQTRTLIGAQARFVRTDLRDDRQVEALMSCGPQILVSNAGGGPQLRPCFPAAEVSRWTASLLELQDYKGWDSRNGAGSSSATPERCTGGRSSGGGRFWSPAVATLARSGAQPMKVTGHKSVDSLNSSPTPPM